MSDSLREVLDLKSPQILAVAGSGGKTTLIYALARELAGAGQPVVISTTTHIFPPAGDQADELWLLDEAVPSGVEIGRRLAPGKRLAVTGPKNLAGKLGGLTDEQIEALAGGGETWVLVEADGSARRPLKAWAEWEPALPWAAASLAVVAGLSGLGRPLWDEWVHRPEIFEREADLTPGQSITPNAMARVLLGPGGPLRAWPAEKPVNLVLNQADTAPPEVLEQCLEAIMDQIQARPVGPPVRVLAGYLRQARLWGL